MMRCNEPVLLIHGGAWAMPDDAVAAHEAGIANALAAGYALLEKGASAVDAVEAAVAVMEDDETFDAGRGSFLTQDGRVQMDALLMNGENLRTGGVACVERLRNPIRAARLVLDKSRTSILWHGRGAICASAWHGALRQHGTGDPAGAGAPLQGAGAMSTRHDFFRIDNVLRASPRRLARYGWRGGAGCSRQSSPQAPAPAGRSTRLRACRRLVADWVRLLRG